MRSKRMFIIIFYYSILEKTCLLFLVLLRKIVAGNGFCEFLHFSIILNTPKLVKVGVVERLQHRLTVVIVLQVVYD